MLGWLRAIVSPRVGVWADKADKAGRQAIELLAQLGESVVPIGAERLAKCASSSAGALPLCGRRLGRISGVERKNNGPV